MELTLLNTQEHARSHTYLRQEKKGMNRVKRNESYSETGGDGSKTIREESVSNRWATYIKENGRGRKEGRNQKRKY